MDGIEHTFGLEASSLAASSILKICKNRNRILRMQTRDVGCAAPSPPQSRDA
jgi:hypothetical protein